MKNILIIMLTATVLFFGGHVYADKFIQVKISGLQAKNIYQTMTGSAVQNEGAAGHLYRTGKHIACVYINADIDDKNGNPIAANDPRRYTCTIQVNQNGLVDIK